MYTTKQRKALFKKKYFYQEIVKCVEENVEVQLSSSKRKSSVSKPSRIPVATGISGCITLLQLAEVQSTLSHKHIFCCQIQSYILKGYDKIQFLHCHIAHFFSQLFINLHFDKYLHILHRF